jgi:hypothetical protein
MMIHLCLEHFPKIFNACKMDAAQITRLLVDFLALLSSQSVINLAVLRLPPVPAGADSHSCAHHKDQAHTDLQPRCVQMMVAFHRSSLDADIAEVVVRLNVVDKVMA